MDLKERKVYKKKKINALYLSIGFFVFSVLLTGLLYFYNITLINGNSKLDNQIMNVDKSISDLEKDPNVIVSSLYNSNNVSINKLEDYSKITVYINHLYALSRIYKINFVGFNYSLGRLSTTVTANSDLYGNLNYMKAAKFIKEYRENVNNEALFDLGLVKSVITKNNRVVNEFSINLVLKNNISKILSDIEKKNLEEKNLQSEEERLKAEEIKKRIADLKKLNEKEQNSSGAINE